MTTVTAPPPVNRETAQPVAAFVTEALKGWTISIKWTQPDERPSLPVSGVQVDRTQASSPPNLDSASFHRRLLKDAIVRQYSQATVPDNQLIIASKTFTTYATFVGTSGQIIPRVDEKEF